MLDTCLGLFDSAALNAQNNITRSTGAYLDYFFPVYNTLATGTAGGSAGDLASFILGLLYRDIFGVDMY